MKNVILKKNLKYFHCMCSNFHLSTEHEYLIIISISSTSISYHNFTAFFLHLQSNTGQAIPIICGLNTGQHSKDNFYHSWFFLRFVLMVKQVLKYNYLKSQNCNASHTDFRFCWYWDKNYAFSKLIMFHNNVLTFFLT